MKIASLESKFTAKNKIYQCYFMLEGLAGECRTLKAKAL
jgi:hypothetical protein